MYLLFLSKYLTYAFFWGSFKHNGDGKALRLCLYPVKYLDESILYDFYGIILPLQYLLH